MACSFDSRFQSDRQLSGILLGEVIACTRYLSHDHIGYVKLINRTPSRIYPMSSSFQLKRISSRPWSKRLLIYASPGTVWERCIFGFHLDLQDTPITVLNSDCRPKGVTWSQPAHKHSWKVWRFRLIKWANFHHSQRVRSRDYSCLLAILEYFSPISQPHLQTAELITPNTNGISTFLY